MLIYWHWFIVPIITALQGRQLLIAVLNAPAMFIAIIWVLQYLLGAKIYCNTVLRAKRHEAWQKRRTTDTDLIKLDSLLPPMFLSD
jgi:hypothetical protein